MTIGLGLAMIGMIASAMVGYLAGAVAHVAKAASDVELMRTVYADGWRAGKEWQQEREDCAGEEQEG